MSRSSLALPFVMALSSGCASPPEVRVANGTGLPITDIEIEYDWERPERTHWRIDSLGGADTTAYRQLRNASPVPRARARYGERSLVARPQDRMGEAPLEAGRYSYVLRLAGADQLIVVLQREALPP